MARLPFSVDPLTEQLDAEARGAGIPTGRRLPGARTEAPSPDQLRAEVERIARQSKVPVNVLMALAEKDGAQDAETALASVARHAEALAGQDLEKALGADGAAVLDRADEIGKALYPGKDDAAPPAGERGIGTSASDLTRSASGGVTTSVGAAVKGTGDMADALLTHGGRRSPDSEVVEGPDGKLQLRFNEPLEEALAPDAGAPGTALGRGIRAAGDYVKGRGEATLDRRSQGLKDKLEKSQPDGNIFDPKTITFGEDPSIEAYLNMGVEAMGSLGPVILGGVLGPAGSAAVGVAQSGGSAADEAESELDKWAKEPGEDGKPSIYGKSSLYARLVDGGETPERALELTKQQARQSVFGLAGAVGGAGGYATNRIMSAPLGALKGRSLPVRVGGTAALSAAEEGAQEVGETLAKNYGMNTGVGADEPMADGTFGDFVLGAMAGGGMGAAAGFGRDRKEDGPLPPESGPLPPERGLPAPPLGLPAPDGPAAPAPMAGDVTPPPAPSGAPPAAPVPPGPIEDAEVVSETPPAPPPKGRLEAALDAAAPPAPPVAPVAPPGADTAVMVTDAASGESFEATFTGEGPDGVSVTIAGETFVIPREDLDSGAVSITAAQTMEDADDGSALRPHAFDDGRGEPAAPAGGDLAPGIAGGPAAAVAGADDAAGRVGADNGPAKPATGDGQGLDGDADAGDLDGAVTPKPAALTGEIITPEDDARREQEAAREAGFELGDPPTPQAAPWWRDADDDVRAAILDEAGRSTANEYRKAMSWDRLSDKGRRELQEAYGRLYRSGAIENAGTIEAPRPALAGGSALVDKTSENSGLVAEAAAQPDPKSDPIPQPIIEPIREKAAILRGWPEDAPPNVPGISLKWDERAGGFIFSRKHTDKVQAAVDAATAPPVPGSVAAASAETEAAPTDGQKEAENYRTGKASWNGLRLSIENAQGSERSGTDPDGNRWSVTMPAHYGRILGTEGADGDHVDFYMGGNEDSDFVLIVDQKDPGTDSFDEHKVVLGTADAAEALAIYKAGFSDGSGARRIGGVREMTRDQFKDWLANGDHKKPASPAFDGQNRPVDDRKPASGERQAPLSPTDEAQAPPTVGPQKSGPGFLKALRNAKGKAKAKLRDEATTDYLAPGNVIRSNFGGHDIILDYDAAAPSIRVQPAVRRGDGWVADIDQPARTHRTLPDDRELDIGPAYRGAPKIEAPAPAPDRKPAKPRDYAAEGKAAFEAGQMRRPPADLVKGSDDPQAYNKAAKAWLDAWDRANLAAPIPAKPPARPLVNRIRKDKAITARGRELPVEYAIMDLADMIPSQTDEGRANPVYPAELQPRDRSGNRSQEQVRKIAADLRPELLGESPQASTGAPIVTPQGVVISGNGRTLALRQAYQRGPEGERYRAFLEAQGYDLGGMKQPALVRVLSDDMDTDALAATAREANERDTATMSASEQAMADAKTMTAGVLDLYRGGDVDSAGNRDFVRGFLGQVVSPAEMGNLIRDDGSMTQDAVRRVQAAMLARAYGDADLIGAIMESTESSIKAIGGALMDVAPRWAQMRDAARDEVIAPEMDQTDALLEAVRLVDRARRSGRKVDEFVGQGDMFSGESVTPMGKTFLGFMFRDAPRSYGQARGREKLENGLRFYADEAMKTQPGADMLGETANPQGIANTAKGKLDGSDGQQQQTGLFGNRDGGGREGDGSPVETGARPGRPAEPARAGGPDPAGAGEGQAEGLTTAPLPVPSDRATMMVEAMGLGDDPYAAGRIQEEADREGWDNLAFHFKIEYGDGRHTFAWTDARGKIIARMKRMGAPAAVRDGRYRDALSSFTTVSISKFRPEEAFRKAWEASGQPRAPQKNTPKPAPDELPMPAGYTLGSARKMNQADVERAHRDPDARGREWARGDFHAVISRQSPYSVVGGYGKTRAEAINDAIQRAERAAPSPAEQAPAQSEASADDLLSAALDDVFGAEPEAEAAPAQARRSPGDPDYSRDDAVADLHALEEQRDGGMIADARLEERIRKQRAVVDSMGPKPRAPRTAKQAAASAVQNTAAGVAGIVDGLNALFGADPNKLNSGLAFDEKTYAKAKPMFSAAVRAFGRAGQDIADLARAMVRGLAENGLTRKAQENMRPYLTRFIEDMRNGAIDPFSDDPQSDTLGSQEGNADADADSALDQGSVGGREPRRPADGARPEDGGDAGNRGGEAGSDAEGQRGELASGLVGDRAGSPRDPAAERAGESQGNFVITPDFPLGEGTDGQKIANNIAAIRLVKALEAENRYATPAEQEVLARYVGWGGLKSVFDPRKTGASDQYGRAQATLKEILTDKEYRAAARSTADAHYTSRTVVSAMWDAMRRFGFDGGRAMEPTIGTGNFVGLMPSELSGKTEWFAAELDRVTGLIARHLYPDATVFDGMGFQDAPFRHGSVDVAIGNPPFGSDTIKSKLYPEIPPLSVHNFIIAKTGMHLRNGGIMGMVVTNRFLDTPNPQARSYLARHFDFLGAVRLPNTAFKGNAGTEVTTDIVWFQKRPEGDPKGDLSWLDTDVAGPNGTTLNGYFAANPDMMLGRPGMDGTLYGGKDEFTLHDDGRDLPEALREGLGRIEAHLPGRTEALESAVVEGPTTSDLAIGQSILLPDGKIMMRHDDDADGNAVVEEVTEDTIWGDAGLPLVRVHDAASAARDAIRNGTPDQQTAAVEAAMSALDDAGSLTATGTLKKTPPTGTGKAAHQAIGDLAEGLTAESPYFGKKQAAALEALDAAIKAKALGPKRMGTLRALLSLRNNTRALLAAENSNDPRMEDMRTALRKEYDAFVKAHGFINSPANDAIIGGVPGIESALESNYKKGNKAKGVAETAKPAAILRQRIITPYSAATSAATPADGVHVSLRERGRLDVDLIAKLTGMEPAAVYDALTEGDTPLAFEDPVRGELVLADEYLSGNLADKIEQAQRAAMPRNVAALKKAMPEPKTADQISPTIRGLWIPNEVFKDFLTAMGAVNPVVRTDMKSGSVFIQASGNVSDFGAQFRTEKKDPFEIFEAAARGKAITVYEAIDRNTRVKDETETRNANAAIERMNAEFQKWAYINPDRRAKIVAAFNEKMNVIVERKFDGVTYLTTVGANPEISLRNSQKNGAWRMILSPSTLLHHVVGAGKTFTAITAVMERKRLGLSRKTLIAVPNHLVTQWGRDFYLLYPGANIMVASEKDFSARNRRKLIARMATGDYDAIIIGHSQLRHIENDPAQVEKIMREQIGDLQESLEEARRNKESGRTVSQIQKRIEKYEAKLDETLAKLRGDSLGFNLTDTGIDNIVVDEAQEFKNLEYSTATERLVGMNSPDGSQRALDLYIKTRSMFDQQGAVGFLTGTPVSNSLVEIYTVLKYMAPQTLRQMGLMHFDSWSSSFIQAQDRFEYTPAMKLKQRRVMSGLVNLGPLSTLYKSFADIVMRPQVEAMYREQVEAENAAEKDPAKRKSTRFPTPKVKGGGRRLITVPASADHSEFTDYLVMRSDGIRRNARDKDYAKKDNMLWVLSDARKASIDIRAVDPRAVRQEGSKVVRAGGEILRVAKQWESVRGAQMVFADSSVPTKTATKQVSKSIAEAWKRAGLSPQDVKSRMAQDARAGRPWAEQAGAAMDMIEDRIAAGELTPTQQDTIEEWLNEEGQDIQAVAATADSGFSFYDDLKAYLIENGMKAEEVAFIHDYDTAEKKAALFEDVNAGRVRVLIGSTFKMGAGTNAQERLVGLHHIDAPWRPSDMEQREGRIIRQGNALYEADPEGFEVEIIAYATEKTADVVLWQVLERKAAGIEQFLNSTADALMEDADSDADSYAAFMAQSTGNPVFLRKMQAEKALRDLEAEQSSQRLLVGEAQRFVKDAPGDIAARERRIAAAEKLSFDGYEDAGRSWADYQKAARDYSARKAAHEKAEAEVRQRNADLPKGAKKETLPKFEDRAPEIFPDPKKADAWSRAIIKVLDSIPRQPLADGSLRRVSGIPHIKMGGVSVEIRAWRNDDGRHSYAPILHVSGMERSLLGFGNSVDVKHPLNSRSLIGSMSPESIRATVAEIIEDQQRLNDETTRALPEMERKAAAKIDTALLRERAREAQKFEGLVRLAEVEAAQGRIGKSNRFADMDTKDRDLKLDNSDDAPVKPLEGDRFTFDLGGTSYTARIGANGTSTVRQGSRVQRVWIRGEAADGSQVLFLQERVSPPAAQGQKAEVTAEIVDTWALSDEDSGSSGSSGTNSQPSRKMAKDQRGMNGAPITPAQARRINAAAHDEMARAGLLGKIGVTVETGRVSGVTGRYSQGVISILRARGKGWRHTLDHEILHALRDPARWGGTHGLFTADEWRALVRVARADSGIRSRVEAAYGDLDTTGQVEEMVAELYADWARARRDNPPGPLGAALGKIRSFFRAMASALRGEGFADAAMVMERIARGEVGGRGPDGPGGGQPRGTDGRLAAAKEQRDMPDGPNDRAERRIVGKLIDMARSRGGEAAQMARDAGRFARAVPGEVRKRASKEGLSNALTDAMAGGHRGQWSILGLVPGRALFMELGRDLPTARTYMDAKDAMDTLRNEWQARANDTAVAWRKLLGDEKANSVLMDTMHTATLEQVDPTRPFEPAATDKHRAMVADPTVDERLRRNAQARIDRDTRRKKIWDRLNADLGRLDPAYREMFKTVRDEYGAMADAIEQAVVENIENSMKAAVRKSQDAYDKRVAEIEAEGLRGAARQEAMKEAKERLTRTKARAAFQSRAKVSGLRKKFESNRLEGPYFPLSRFGDYFVTLRDSRGKVVSFSLFENRREQNAWAKEAEAEGYKVEIGAVSNATELKGTVDPGFVAEIEALLGNAGVKSEVMGQVWQHFLGTLPDFSLRKNRIHRKGRAGFNRDAFRAFGRQMFHGAHQLARLKHGVTLTEALAQLEKEVATAADPVRAGLVVNEMNRRHEYTMNPVSAAWTQVASSWAFVWYLGMTPAAAVVNLSQTTVIGIPILSAAFEKQGAKGATAEIGKAYGDFTRGRGHAQQSGRLTDAERRAMQEAYDLGLMEKSQAHDLAGVGETGVQYSDVRARWMAKVSWMFHHAERLNREVTFLAAYRMAVKDGQGHAGAVRAAKDLTWKTHFDYQSSSRPRVMQGDWPKVFLTFRNYTVNAIWRLLRDSQQSLMAETPADRKIARRQLAGITASMFLHAGIRGTWGFGILMGLLSLLGGGDSEDLEEELKRILVGPEGAEGLAAGIRRNVGGMILNGVPGHLTGTNLSDRIGLGDLWFRDNGRIEEGRDAYRSMLEQLAGPVASMALATPYIVGKDIKDGHYWRAAENAMPKFARDWMKSARYANEGVVTRRGDDLVPDVGIMGILSQATGFTPAEVAERYQINNRLYNKQERILDQRRRLHKAAGDAALSGRGIPDSVIRKIQAFNAEYPEKPITDDTLRKSIRARQQGTAKREFGIALDPKLNDRLRGEMAGMIYR